tara:strand:+ start:833 stop:1093 length:261 start_codon:yes stop_codon:yes gene_type:complete
LKPTRAAAAVNRGGIGPGEACLESIIIGAAARCFSAQHTSMLPSSTASTARSRGMAQRPMDIRLRIRQSHLARAVTPRKLKPRDDG